MNIDPILKRLGIVGIILLGVSFILWINNYDQDEKNDKISTEVISHCNDDVSEYGYRIGVLRDGRYGLFHDRFEILITDGNNKDVVSSDTCYLKLRAFWFWDRKESEKAVEFLN